MSDKSPKFSIQLVNYMPFGVINPSEIVETARLAERLGFTGFITSDHLVYHIPVWEPHIGLAAAAAVTSRIKLSVSVALAALRRPLVLAKTCATLDYLSSGRFEAGIGIGGEHAKEWSASQVPISERAKRTDETIEIMKLLWSRDHVTYKGKYFQFEDVSMDPKPPHGIPILIGGRSEHAVRRAARLGDGWVAVWLAPEKLRERLALLDKYAREFDRDPSTIDKRFQVYIRVDSSRDRARQAAERFLSRAYNMSYEPFDRYTAYGTAEDCARYLRPYLELGIDHFYFAMIYEPGGPLAMTEKLHNEVLPILMRGQGQDSC